MTGKLIFDSWFAAPSPFLAAIPSVVLSTPAFTPTVAAPATPAAPIAPVAPTAPAAPQVATYATVAPTIITAALQGITIPHISPVDKLLLLLVVLKKVVFPALKVVSFTVKNVVVGVVVDKG